MGIPFGEEVRVESVIVVPEAVYECLDHHSRGSSASRREVVHQTGLGDIVELRELGAHCVFDGRGARDHVARDLPSRR